MLMYELLMQKLLQLLMFLTELIYIIVEKKSKITNKPYNIAFLLLL